MASISLKTMCITSFLLCLHTIVIFGFGCEPLKDYGKAQERIALLSKAHKFLEQENYEEAARIFYQLEALYRQDKSNEVMVFLTLNSIGSCHEKLGESDKAVAAYTRAIAAYHELEIKDHYTYQRVLEKLKALSANHSSHHALHAPHDIAVCTGSP